MGWALDAVAYDVHNFQNSQIIEFAIQFLLFMNAALLLEQPCRMLVQFIVDHFLKAIQFCFGGKKRRKKKQNIYIWEAETS